MTKHLSPFEDMIKDELKIKTSNSGITEQNSSSREQPTDLTPGKVGCNSHPDESKNSSSAQDSLPANSDECCSIDSKRIFTGLLESSGSSLDRRDSGIVGMELEEDRQLILSRISVDDQK